MYLFIKLDTEFKSLEKELEEFIYNTFNNLNKDKINIVHDRYTNQLHWIPFIEKIKSIHGDELVWLTQNDDHIFIDFDNSVLNEGIELLKNETNNRKSLYFSHWPEILKLSGKFEEPKLINNYVKFNMSLLDSIQIFNMNYLYYIFVEYKWKKEYIKIDSILNSLVAKPSYDNNLKQVIYVPLREMVRHFDAYDHVNMNRALYPLMNLGNNTITYSKEDLRNRLTAPHKSAWTAGNVFEIPEKWVEINKNLHNEDLKIRKI